MTTSWKTLWNVLVQLRCMCERVCWCDLLFEYCGRWEETEDGRSENEGKGKLWENGRGCKIYCWMIMDRYKRERGNKMLWKHCRDYEWYWLLGGCGDWDRVTLCAGWDWKLWRFYCLLDCCGRMTKEEMMQARLRTRLMRLLESKWLVLRICHTFKGNLQTILSTIQIFFVQELRFKFCLAYCWRTAKEGMMKARESIDKVEEIVS